MKKLYKTVLLLLLPLFGFSQNLIPNGSFESGISPWGGLGGCPIASYYFSAGNNCSNQYDYLAEVDPVTCSLPQITLDLGVPENHFGYIHASDGNKYAGVASIYYYSRTVFYTFNNDVITSNNFSSNSNFPKYMSYLPTVNLNYNYLINDKLTISISPQANITYTPNFVFDYFHYWTAGVNFSVLKRI
jgi:hypothetical protein